MTDARKAAIEAMAEALYTDSAKEQSDARTWAEMQAEHPADYEGVTRFYSRAAAALDALVAALPALGLRVVPTKGAGIVDMVAAFWRFKNGHHFHDEPPPVDTSDVGAMKAAIAATRNVLGETT